MIPNECKMSPLQIEHDEIHRQIDDWRAWWKELNEMGWPNLGEMVTRVRHIREQLCDHFAHEDATGLPSRIANGDPQFREGAKAARCEHEQLLRHLDTLIDKMRSCGGDQLCWGGAAREFELFLNRLAQHELNESALLSAAQTDRTGKF